jgi:hypothetical protein
MHQTQILITAGAGRRQYYFGCREHGRIIIDKESTTK